MQDVKRADLITTMQIRDRVTGKIFGWSEDDPYFVYVFPRPAEPGTRAVASDRISVDDINPITGVLAHPTFVGVVSKYLTGSLKRVA